jgi:uncharacterized phage protein gp47/JayE
MATLPVVGEAAYPTPADVLEVILASILLGAQQQGLVADVRPGSDHYIRAKAIAGRVSMAIANGKIARDNYSPLTATGDALVALAGIYGVAKRPASRAAGYVVVTVAGGTASIPAGFQLTAPSGEKYQTTTAAVVATGGSVQAQAVNGGASTNVAAGAKMTFDSASIGNLNQVCTVDVGGIDGGVDADDTETLRRRLINKLASPGVGGNVSQVQQWAEESSAAVEAAYVYAAARGPSSYDIAVTSATGDRTLSSTIVDTVAAYVTGKMPGNHSLNVTSVSPQEVDVVLLANLALPGSAGGTGGGWRDAAPWPSATSGNVKITSFNSTTKVATTDATALNGLAIGAHIGLWDPVTDPTAPAMREHTVDSCSVSGGFVIFTAQGGISFDPTGGYISTGAVNLTSYASTTLSKIRALGPGEKTTNIDILPRGRRQPTADISGETDLNSKITTQIQTSHSEIRSVDYSIRYDTGTTSTRTSPSVPTTTASAPKILVLKWLAIRKA